MNLIEYLNGDPYAASFCTQIEAVAHMWDDLVDRDKDRSNGEIDAVFTSLLWDIPSNPFYRTHETIIRPCLLNVILQWKAANVLVRSDVSSQRCCAYMLRNALLSVFALCIYLTGGDNQTIVRFWAEATSEFEHLYGIFMQEMTNA